MDSIAGEQSISVARPIQPTDGLMRRPEDNSLIQSSWYSPDVVSQRVQLVQQIYRSIMHDGTHYGKIPGCGDKPTLLKAGSEQLLMTFKLAVRPEVLDLSTPDCARYRVTVHITHAPTGNYLGSGLGECSSDELKYKWRAAVCKEEWDAAPVERRRLVYKNGARGAYTVQQVRQEIADVANTVLKMAKKRAQIDATLTVTAASDIFTQDIEDTPIPVEDGEVEQKPQAMPQRKSATHTPTNQEPERRAENVTQPTAGKKHCQECGEVLESETCSRCGWTIGQPTMAHEEQQPRQNAPQQQVRQQAPTRQGTKISEAQGKRFFAVAMSNGITKPEMKQYLKNTFGIDSDRDLLMGQEYDRAIAWAQGQ